MPTTPHPDDPRPDVDALVIGAGFAGLYVVHRLRDELGLSVLGVDSAPDVGGTWYWNRYPGARTDSLFLVYGFSFSAELVNDWTWTERYPSQPEVLAYLGFVADRLDLRRSFRFGATVESAHFDEEHERWRVTTGSGDVVTTRYLVTAVGLLSAPNVPPFAHLEEFSGPVLHTGAWPVDADLAGKRVGLVGTGSTGIQLLPEIAPEAAHVTVFQRTPNYVVPARNRELTAAEVADLRARHREIAAAIREHPFAMAFETPGRKVFDVDEDTRRAVYEEAWEKGGFFFLFESFDDLQLDETANETACEFIRGKIREIVDDPATAELLSPRGYPYGSKRPPAGTGYYETFNRDDVELVDVAADPIREITPGGLRTAGREFGFDVLVLATGFDASTGAFTRIDIRGRGGERLADAWRDGPVTNLGFSAAGFPNLLMVTGPLSPFANIPTCIEETAGWIVDLVARMERTGARTVEADAEAARAWFDHVQEIGNMIVAGRGKAVNTWFAGANIEGKPQVFNVYFGGSNHYFTACRASARQDYAGFVLR